MKRMNKALLSVAVLLLVVLGFQFNFSGGNYSWMKLDYTVVDNAKRNAPTYLPRWKPGLLDIHHLHVGSSVSTFVILPDGTTILIDAGEIDLEQQRSWWKSLGPPYDQLKALDPVPDSSKQPTGWILEYLQEFWPKNDTTNPTQHNNQKKLDYVLVTHFHSDHMGNSNSGNSNSVSNHGNYSLSGIPGIAAHMKIGTLIDRGYPDYAFPRKLRTVGDSNIDNYLRFVNATHESSIHFEQFQVGSKQQIRLMNQPTKHDATVQVLKSSNVVMDKLDDSKTHIINGTILDERGKWDENSMSAAFLIQYGGFRYYEGADQEVVRNHQGEIIFDTIGPTAQAAGNVDVATLNHHGHGITRDFVELMDPPVMILQGWCSDQPKTESLKLLATATTNPNPNLAQQQRHRQIFATHVFPERLQALGPSLSSLFASTSGHVVIRVHPPPPSTTSEKASSHEPFASTGAENQYEETKQTYEVFVLDGYRKVKSYHGHYPVRGQQG